MIAETDRIALLRLARTAIVAHVTGCRALNEALGCDVSESLEVLGTPGAAFVTLHHHGRLRGCVGRLDWSEPLGEVIPSCAVSACSADPRFPPVALNELDALAIELSLLRPLERLTGPDDIEIGRHGLVVERGRRRGLLLPQVATEWQWDRLTFLAQTCHKAGLPLDAWKSGASVWRFEAEVFGEPRT